MLTIFSVLTRCLGFIFKIYLTKIMTTTELGIYNLSLSIYMVLITLVGSGIPLTISKITSSNNKYNKPEETHYSITASLIISLLVSIFISFVILFSNPLLTLIIGDTLGYKIILSLTPSIIFTALYSQIRGYLWGIENYYSVSMVEFVEQILRIGFCIIFSLTGYISNPTIAVCVSLSIACGISTIYGFLLYFKNNGKFKYKHGYYKQIITSTIPLTAVRLFGSLLQPIIAIILPFMLCAQGMSKSLALSELGVIMGMTLPLLSIPSTIIGSLCMILVPRLNLDNSPSGLNVQINNYMKFTITCIFLFVPLFIALSPEICNYVYGNMSAGVYMSYCTWTIVPLGIAQITTAILNALNQEQKTFVYYIFSSIILILFTILLPSMFGAKAMIIASGISNIMLSYLNIRKINSITNTQSQLLKSIIYYTLISIPIIILNNFLYPILLELMGVFLSLFITSIISCISYFGLLFVFGIFELSTIKNLLIKFKSKKSIQG